MPRKDDTLVELGDHAIMRLHTRASLPLAFALAFAFACQDDPEPLTCAYLEDPGNCWASTAAELAACLPELGASGVLAPDRSSCSFENGAVVQFETPLPNTTEELERLAFTIELDGSTCGSFVDTFENRQELEAGGESVFAELRSGTFTLDCGEAAYESSFESLFDCPGGTQPTDAFSVEPALVSFSISSVATPGELFRCTL